MYGNQLGRSGSEICGQGRSQRGRLGNGATVRTPTIGEPDLRPRILPPPPGLLAAVGHADVDRLLHAGSQEAWNGNSRDSTIAKRSAVGRSRPCKIDLP